MIKLSICIPTYNRAPHLSNCLQSIISMRKPKGFQFEICISDNGSNDNSKEIVNNAKKDIDINYNKNESNLGIARNFLKVVSMANGEFVWLIGDDDLLLPHTLDTLEVLFKNNKTDYNWPCLFVKSDTSGEKDFEEFFTENEKLDMHRFDKLGVIKNKLNYQKGKLLFFEKEIINLKIDKSWDKKKIKQLFNYMIPNFEHKETGKYLDNKMYNE